MMIMMTRKIVMAMALAGTVLATEHASEAGELVVIVNKSNPTAAMNKDDVKTHYLKKQAGWSNGEKLRPIDTESSDVRTAFIKTLLGMGTEDLERYWLELRYQKAEAPPKRVDGDAAVIKFVANFKGGIGFVDASSFKGEARDKVKVVLSLKY
jgi:hypothetical protein